MEKKKVRDLIHSLVWNSLTTEPLLRDPDGVSAKAFLDALVKAGVLRCDSCKSIQEPVISHQVKVETEAEERSVVRITRVGGP